MIGNLTHEGYSLTERLISIVIQVYYYIYIKINFSMQPNKYLEYILNYVLFLVHNHTVKLCIEYKKLILYKTSNKIHSTLI